ncbi:hypothetical protein [Microbispora sp. KK1-11]|uniref:hypothetical protein n=1 Tax=Microbispora sp. KK1-11 TaxID=2053005 RepID=UPI00115765DF|nr:hypothetical protein [Microbispora sp. KK1-11]TQS29120.1 hypothetical protein FLW16_12300 [Microbispora sp. KK1-11]
MTDVLDPADPRALLRRLAALERRVRSNEVIARGGQYAADEGGQRTVASAGSFLDFTSQPTVTVAVPDSGRIRVSWGFTGFNSNTGGSTLRLAVAMSGANTQAASVTSSASVAGDNNGAGTDPTQPPISATRIKIYEGLTAGSTTFKLQGRISSGTTSTHSIQDSWLLVEPLP